MPTETRRTVWSYMAVDDDFKRYHRVVFFGAGSTRYHGGWMGPTDSFWIVPEPFPWLQD